MKSYHFIGIGGISMSALALELKSEGNFVSGSDLKPTELTKRLESQGISVYYGHRRSNLRSADFVIANGAINVDNPEIKEANLRGIKIKTRAELLGEVSRRYKNIIAVSGAHGKTTTTEMIAEIFIHAGKKPTVHIGGISKYFNSNLLLGKKRFFITEACEYKNSFLSLNPTTSVILNIEREHLDFFKTFANVKKSFEKFEAKSKICVKLDKKRNIAYTKKLCVEGKNISHLGSGKYGYDAFCNNKYLGKIYLNAIGKHNVLNSLCAICVSLIYKIPFNKISEALLNFKGVKRRYEIVSENPLVVCDYAHHPTEIKKIILSTKRFTKNKIIVAFQPHTYSRTKTLFSEFLTALKLADEVHIIKTYSAREKFDPEASAKYLAENLEGAHYHNSMKGAYNKIKERLNSKCTLLILGAGNIDELAEMFSD